MRVSILAVLVCAFVAVVAGQPVAPVKKAASFQGGAAVCVPGQGVISADGSSAINGCAPCLGGYFQAGSGTLACTACPAGTWSPVGSSACYACPKGTISGTAADACDECPYGTATTGYVVSGGFTGVNRGITSGDITTNTRCFPCDVNFYQPAAAQDRCLPCPANTSTAGAKGAGACFAATGGNTVANVGQATTSTAGGVGAAASLVEVEGTPSKKPLPGQGLASGSANGSAAPHVKPASAGPAAPIRKSKRQHYSASSQKAAKTAKAAGAAKKTRFAKL